MGISLFIYIVSSSAHAIFSQTESYRTVLLTLLLSVKGKKKVFNSQVNWYF